MYTNENEFLANELFLIEQKTINFERLSFDQKLPGGTLKKNSSANMAFSIGLTLVRYRIRLVGKAVKCTWTSVCFTDVSFISKVALRTNIQTLLFFISYFNRISNWPDDKLWLGPFVGDEHCSMETDFDS